MTKPLHDSTPAISDVGDSKQKQPWQAPTVEEIDFSSTAASPIFYGGADGGIYHS